MLNPNSARTCKYKTVEFPITKHFINFGSSKVYTNN